MRHEDTHDHKCAICGAIEVCGDIDCTADYELECHACMKD